MKTTEFKGDKASHSRWTARTWLLLLIFIFPGVLQYPVPACGLETLSRRVKLMVVEPLIQVKHDPGQKKWAEFVMERTVHYIPAVEKLLEWTFPHDPYTIIGAETVRSPSGMIFDGFSRGEEMDLAYRIGSDGNPAIIYHELAHCWFMAWGEEHLEWLIEGIVSFLPVALIDGRLLKDTYQDREKIMAWYQAPSPGPDPPMIKDFRSDPALQSYFYTKAVKVQQLLLKELGIAGYLAFVKDVYNATKISDMDAVCELLARQKKADWKALLTGWVIPGPYGKYKPADF